MYLADLIKDNPDYAFVAGEIKSVENKFLSESQLEKFAESDVSDIVRMLQDSGYSFNSLSPEDIEKGLEIKRLSAREFFRLRMKNEYILLLFEAMNDFHNLKIVKKALLAGIVEFTDLLEMGTVDIDTIKIALEQGEKSRLPYYLQKLFPDIMLFKDMDDIFEMENFVDKTLFEFSLYLAKKSKSRWIEHYIRTSIDILNIKNYARFLRLKKSLTGITSVLIPGGYIDVEFFLRDKDVVSVNLGDIPEIYRNLFKEAISIIDENKSFASVEKMADDIIYEIIVSVKYDIASPEMLTAFYLRQNREIDKLSLIMFAKLGGLLPQEIKEYL